MLKWGGIVTFLTLSHWALLRKALQSVLVYMLWAGAAYVSFCLTSAVPDSLARAKSLLCVVEQQSCDIHAASVRSLYQSLHSESDLEGQHRWAGTSGAHFSWLRVQ